MRLISAYEMLLICRDFQETAIVKCIIHEFLANN